MAKKIYKYFSNDLLDLIFHRDGFCGIKCSLPNEYNDPYELFLGVDVNASTECLATYREIVHEVPQLPTTCFSLSPVVAPMWAHYAKNHSGFVVEFDVEMIEESFEGIAIRDVTYRDGPDVEILDSLERITVTKKTRHAVWLQQTVMSHAYFSKYETWRYEKECRLVDNQKITENIDENNILFVPIDCISSIIIGSKFPQEKLKESKDIAEANKLQWYQSTIGKSLALPFLTDLNGSCFIFDNDNIAEAESICDTCSEPTDGESDLCPWCSITEDHEIEAAHGNPFRLLERYGGLEEYFEAVNKIERQPK